MTIHHAPLAALPAAVRIVVFLGRRDSDHLRELVRIAEFKGRIAYRIEEASQLQPRWFVGIKDVGVVVGASGLEPVLRAVLDRLHSFTGAEAHGILEGIAQ